MTVTESGEFPSSGTTAVQANPGLRNTAFMHLGSLDLPPEKKIEFVTTRKDGWKSSGTLVFRRKDRIPPTREECIAEIHPDLRDQVCGIRDPLSVEPRLCSGEYVYTIDSYRSTAPLS